MKNLIITILFITFISQGFSQVGINTSTPDPSATIDISSTNKGILFPSYDLVDLTDGVNPILNPADGLMVYNSGDMHPSGYYIWINNRWNTVITSETLNKVLFLVVPTTVIGTTNTLYIINPATTNNLLKNMDMISRNASDVSVGSDHYTITLPAGKYKVDIAGDLIKQSNSTSTFGNYYYRSYSTYIKDVNGTILSPAYYDNRVFSANFSSVSWVHYLDLAQTTSFNIYWDTAADSNTDPLRPRTGITIAIYELR